jgi:hypothetical protein
MFKFNFLTHLLGTKPGHAIESDVDSLGTTAIDSEVKSLADTATQSVLTKVGVPTTASGVVSYVEGKIDTAIQSETILDDAEKAILVAVINEVLGVVATKVEAAV